MSELVNGTEPPSGRLGAVLRSLGEVNPVALGPRGPYLATTLAHARDVLTDPDRFDFPVDVSRQRLRSRSEASASSRSPHAITPPLDPAAVARGAERFVAELSDLSSSLGSGSEVDAMELLRDPVSRSTTAAVLPDLHESARNDVAALVVAWIDALGPIISSSRSPGRWSRVRRDESRSRRALHAALTTEGIADPAAVATVLAAGIQVPIAAGAWLMVKLAEDPALALAVRQRADLAAAVAWETVRLCPPTWITARITAVPVTLGETGIDAGMVVMVSPLLLGRIESLAPGREAGNSPLDRFDPLRWDQKQVRPGAWLPFGAGPHACPGRNLGLAQLTHLAGWAGQWSLSPVLPVQIDQSRGIFPRPARLHLTGSTPSASVGSGAPQQNGPS